jgi:DNA-directed RNA polymerase subunit RPC12/RpoP
MKQIICSFIVKSIAGLMIAPVMLLLPACILLGPYIGRGGGVSDLENLTGQKIPMPGKPFMEAYPCPACKRMIKTPDGKMPSSCPYCSYSFVQPANPKPTPQTKPKLQAINPFGDFLFKDVPIIPVNGKLQTRHLDPNGLAVKAEEWGKEMKQVDDQSRQKQEDVRKKFEQDKEDAIKKPGSTGPAMQQLKNPFADDANVVDLRGSKTLTPKLLNDDDPKSSGEPLESKKLSEQPLGTLTDQELAERSAEDQKKIQSLMLAAKRDVDTGTRQQKVWSGVEDDLRDAKADLAKSTASALVGTSLAGEKDALEGLEYYKSAKGVEALDKSVTLAEDLPDVYSASKNNDWVKGVGAVGDIGIGFLSKGYSEPYTVAKYGIDYTAALWSLGIGGNTIQQLNSQNQQRLSAEKVRAEKLKELEEDQKRIKAENDRRAGDE